MLYDRVDRAGEKNPARGQGRGLSRNGGERGVWIEEDDCNGNCGGCESEAPYVEWEWAYARRCLLERGSFEEGIFESTGQLDGAVLLP